MRSNQPGIRAAGACAIALAIATALTVRPARGDSKEDHSKLPPGPIRDRADLMEGVGKNAKAIGGALKAGKPADIEKPAADIASVMDKYVTLFPEGSQGHGSRAKPAVWTDRKKFDELAMQLKDQANALAAAAKSGGDVKAASASMFNTCKACHTDFREKMEGE
ncbi:MAG TPA: cytochrome c [Candidatus Binatia bacterium]|nr:cytochrome c [Candidatus Binatia bacterium]